MTATISRRQILSRSRDAGLDHISRFAPYEDYEEMWFSHEHLFKDHIAEVLRKWDQIDDEIWAKMIFMSRNRRIAKAYVRVPAVIIDGSDNGFDGYRVGLNGFEDPFRDEPTHKLMGHIDKGCRIGIDDSGNIVLKRYSTSGVFIKTYPMTEQSGSNGQSMASQAVLRVNGRLEQNKPYVIFDMAKFEQAMAKEMVSAYPDRRKLEQKCIVVIGFVRDHPRSVLEMPIYVMFINIVALDLLKSKLNPVAAIYQSINDHSPLHKQHQQQQSIEYSSDPSRAKTNHPLLQSKTRAQQGKIPDFVSIFQPYDHEDGEELMDDEEEYDEDDDTIYGRIAGTSDDYFTLAQDGGHRKNGGGGGVAVGGRRPKQQQMQPGSTLMGRKQQRINREQENGNSSIQHFMDRSNNDRSSTTTMKRHLEGRNGTNKSAFSDYDYLDPGSGGSSGGSGSGSNGRPPKLPPRDKKKLHKQIDTIRSNRVARERGTIPSGFHSAQSHEERHLNRSISIPSPDYLQDDEDDDDDGVQSDCENRTRSRFPSSSRPHLYHHDDHDQRKGRNAPTMHRHSSYLPPTSGGDHSSLSYRERQILDEDPYYSGLEARLTSKKHHHSSSSNSSSSASASSSKMKGLHWMVRKVLSTSNYLNMLTTTGRRRRGGNHKGTPPSSSNTTSHRPPLPLDAKLAMTMLRQSSKSSKSLNEYSTDSDPYASINEVYEPIYGYAGQVPQGPWATLAKLDKKKNR